MGRLLRSPALALIGAQLLIWSGCAKRLDRPNIILISLDCLNQRQFESAVGSGIAPSLSELKNDSIAFSRAYAQAPWTNPSHMSMFTGLYPSQHGRDVPYGLMIAWNDFFHRVPLFKTMGDHLSEAGYETAAFVGMGSISGVYGIRQGFEEFEEFHKNKEFSDLVASFDRATDWIANRKEKPFFLFFHTYDLHAPWPTWLATEEDAIRHLDLYIGKLLLQLKTLSVYDTSFIILTGDHGSNMIETEGKCSVHGAGHYEENIRIPLLLKLPRSSEGRKDSRLARHIDLLPTVLEAVDLSDSLYRGPGDSLLRRLEEGSSNRERLSFSEADGRCAARRALVTDRHKYIYTPKGHAQALLQGNVRFFDEDCPEICRDLPIEEFYDLSNDPFENRDLLEEKLSAENEERLKRFRLEMAKHLNLPRRYEESVVVGPKHLLGEPELEELRKSLKTLGYIR